MDPDPGPDGGPRSFPTTGPVVGDRDRRAGVDRQIREAIDRGEFDDLPGAGRPLRPELLSRDEHWWIRQFAEREQVPGSAFLPAALQIRKEVQTLAERVTVMGSEAAVRREIRDLNARIRSEILLPTSGIVLGVAEQDEQEAVRRWQAAVAARRAAAGAPAAAPPARRGRWHRFWFGPGPS